MTRGAAVFGALAVMFLSYGCNCSAMIRRRRPHGESRIGMEDGLKSCHCAKLRYDCTLVQFKKLLGFIFALRFGGTTYVA